MHVCQQLALDLIVDKRHALFLSGLSCCGCLASGRLFADVVLEVGHLNLGLVHLTFDVISEICCFLLEGAQDLFLLSLDFLPSQLFDFCFHHDIYRGSKCWKFTVEFKVYVGHAGLRGSFLGPL